MAKIPTLPKKPPEPKEDKDVKKETAPLYDDTKVLIYRQEFERAIKWIDERIINTNYIMGVIIVVLFIGFLTLLFSLLAIFGQYVGLKTSSDVQVINALNELKNEVKKQSNSQVNLNLQYEKKEATPTGQ